MGSYAFLVHTKSITSGNLARSSFTALVAHANESNTFLPSLTFILSLMFFIETSASIVFEGHPFGNVRRYEESLSSYNNETYSISSPFAIISSKLWRSSLADDLGSFSCIGSMVSALCQIIACFICCFVKRWDPELIIDTSLAIVVLSSCNSAQARAISRFCSVSSEI